jgi:Ser/Thr protein kinase RdoA (MazF antagonist)
LPSWRVGGVPNGWGGLIYLSFHISIAHGHSSITQRLCGKFAYNGGMTKHPFENLTPDCVQDALHSVGLPGDGRMLALNSYENRVYQVGIEDAQPMVVKFYRPARWSDAAILEDHRFVDELAANEVPVVPAVATANGQTLHHFAGFAFAVFPRRGGRAPELDRAGTLEWIGRFLGRIHAVGAEHAFAERPLLDLASFGFASRDFLLEHGFIPGTLQASWESVVAQALAGVAECYQRAGTVTTLRLHGDCHPGNILWTDDGPHFVDFDDCRQGPAIQDLWMLLSGDAPEQAQQLAQIIKGYSAFHRFDRRQLHLIEALRTLRLLHYSAWLARRQDDPAFAVAFPWFNTVRYWQDRILELREQIALMQEPVLDLP